MQYAHNHNATPSQTQSYYPTQPGLSDNNAQLKQHYEQLLERERREAEELRAKYELELAQAKQESERLQREYLARVENEKNELDRQRREHEALQMATRQSAKEIAAKLRAEAEEEARRAHNMLIQQKRQLAQEISQAEAMAAEQVALAERDRREAERHIASSQVRHKDEMLRAEEALETLKSEAVKEREDIDSELARQIQELMVNPPPPPPRPTDSGRTRISVVPATGNLAKPIPESSGALTGPCTPVVTDTARLAPDMPPAGPSKQTPYYPPPPAAPVNEVKAQVSQSEQDRASVNTSAPNQQKQPVQATSPVASKPKMPTPHACGVTPVVECITAPVKLDTTWFVHAAVSDFLVCSRCYVDHIYDTTLRESFTRRRFDDFESVPRRCYFGSNRVKNSLWPAAVSSGSLVNMLDYMKSRPRVEECPSTNAQESRTWWVTPDAPGLSICSACYEDEILAGSFAERFRLEELPKGYICDMALWFINRMHEKHAEIQDWTGFVGEVKDRIQIAVCPKMQVVPSSSRTWLASKREPTALQICYACYGDFFYGTPNETYFYQTMPQTKNARCLLGNFNLLIPAQQAIAKKDPELFWRSIEAVDRQPYCDPNGITGGTWYTLPNNPDGFGVCGACFAGIIEPLGGSQLFVRKANASSSEATICCFNPGHTRFGGFMSVIAPTLYTNSWKPLGEFAATFAKVPRCPRDSMNTPPNRRYWGWDDIHICEECYLTFAKGTALEPMFVMKGEVIAASRLCDLYSPRMRGMYTDASEGRLPLAELLAFANQRRVIYIQTVPECERILNQQKIMALQAQNLGIMGTAYKSMGGTLDAVTGHSYTVGNAYVGYGHANEMVFQGALYDKQSRELSSSVTSGSAMLQIQMLEQRWRAVE